MKMLKYRNREEWLELRRTGIGGSDIAAIMGLHPYKTAGQVWDSKVMGMEEPVVNHHMKRGQALEPVAADEYAEITGRFVEPVNAIIQSDQNPMFLASVDRLQFNNEASHKIDPPGILEIKVPSTWTARKIAESGLPEYQFMQLQWYLMVANMSWGSFALLDADRWQLKYFDVDRDERAIAAAIGSATAFCDMMRAGIRPADDQKIDVDLPVVGKDDVVVSRPDMAEALADLSEAKTILSEAKELEESRANRVRELAGNDQIIYTGDYRLYYQPTAGRKTFDPQAFGKAFPKIDLTPYYKKGKPSRPLRLYKTK